MHKKTICSIALILVTSAPLILMGIGLTYCSYKRGFSIDKISSKLPYNELWETEPLAVEEKEYLIRDVFSQTFYYIGSGDQCYTFASSDHKYVLKFFKMHKLLPRSWATDFPFFFFEKLRLDNVEKKQHVLENAFQSFKNTYDYLREESGLIFLHLNKTRDLNTAITISYEGQHISVDLDSKEFALQFKADKICDFFFTFKGNKKQEELHQAVRSFFELIAEQCKKGFKDQGIGIRNNLGFVNGRAILIDCGHLSMDESLKYSYYFQTEILRAAERLSHWAEAFYPELILVLQEEAQCVIDKHVR